MLASSLNVAIPRMPNVETATKSEPMEPPELTRNFPEAPVYSLDISRTSTVIPPKTPSPTIQVPPTPQLNQHHKPSPNSQKPLSAPYALQLDNTPYPANSRCSYNWGTTMRGDELVPPTNSFKIQPTEALADKKIPSTKEAMFQNTTNPGLRR